MLEIAAEVFGGWPSATLCRFQCLLMKDTDETGASLKKNPRNLTKAWGGPDRSNYR